MAGEAAEAAELAMRESFESSMRRNIPHLEGTFDTFRVSEPMMPDVARVNLERIIGEDAMKGIEIKLKENGKMEMKSKKAGSTGIEVTNAMLSDSSALSETLAKVLKDDSATFGKAKDYVGGKEIKKNLTKPEIEIAAKEGYDKVFKMEDIVKQKEFMDALSGVPKDPTIFDRMVEGTIKLITDPEMIKLGFKVVLGVLSFAALNQMAKSSNGCYVFDTVTGAQLEKISTGDQPCDCTYKGKPGQSSADILSGGAVRAACEAHCADNDNAPTNYDSAACKQNPSRSNCGCFDNVSALCNCREKDPTSDNPDATKLSKQNYQIRYVKDDAFSMMAKVLAAGGATITGFTGTLEDGALSLVKAVSSAGSGMKTIIIVAVCIAGAVILAIGIYYITQAVRRNNAQGALGQQNSRVQLVALSPPPGQMPLNPQIGGGGRGMGRGMSGGGDWLGGGGGTSARGRAPHGRPQYESLLSDNSWY